MSDFSTIPAPLRPEPISDDRYRINNTGSADQRDVVFGGQFLAQAIVTAATRHPGKAVRSIQAVFARPGRIDAPTELSVESIHDGRTFASDTVTAWQGDRLCARFLVLLDADEPDVVRHDAPRPRVTAPADTPPTDQGLLVYPGTELRIVDGVDLWSVDARHRPGGDLPLGPVTGAPRRTVGAPGRARMGDRRLPDRHRAATARGHRPGRRPSGPLHRCRRPHHRVPRAVPCRRVAAARAPQPVRGRGRTFGTADVFTEDGGLVASYVQTNMVRFFADPALADGTQYRTVM